MFWNRKPVMFVGSKELQEAIEAHRAVAPKGQTDDMINKLIRHLETSTKTIKQSNERFKS